MAGSHPSPSLVGSQIRLLRYLLVFFGDLQHSFARGSIVRRLSHGSCLLGPLSPMMGVFENRRQAHLHQAQTAPELEKQWNGKHIPDRRVPTCQMVDTADAKCRALQQSLEHFLWVGTWQTAEANWQFSTLGLDPSRTRTSNSYKFRERWIPVALPQPR
jgi:hypothetical protein